MRHIIACESANFVNLQETKTNAFLDARCFVLWGIIKLDGFTMKERMELIIHVE